MSAVLMFLGKRQDLVGDGVFVFGRVELDSLLGGDAFPDFSKRFTRIWNGIRVSFSIRETARGMVVPRCSRQRHHPKRPDVVATLLLRLDGGDQVLECRL